MIAYFTSKIHSDRSAVPGKALRYPKVGGAALFINTNELGCKIDFLASHSYTCNAERDLDFVNDLYER